MQVPACFLHISRSQIIHVQAVEYLFTHTSGFFLVQVRWIRKLCHCRYLINRVDWLVMYNFRLVRLVMYNVEAHSASWC